MKGELRSYGKVFALGHRAIQDLFDGPVSVSEKCDGSQFSFGLVEREAKGFWEYCCRSKSKDQTPPMTDKMFELAVAQTKDLDLRPGWTYRGEFLSKPKHNTLKYDRVPARNVILFDIDRGDQDYLDAEELTAEALRLGLEAVPIFRVGIIDSWEQLKLLLEQESCLGGVKVEGVVAKNYAKFGEDKKVLMGKYVSEEYKEVHEASWKKANPGSKDVIETLISRLRTDVRWLKAVQHLREDGLLQGAPQDIGPLIKEVQRDVRDEEEERIRDALFGWAFPKIERAVIAGLPEWYKEALAQQQFDDQPPANTVTDHGDGCCAGADHQTAAGCAEHACAGDAPMFDVGDTIEIEGESMLVIIGDMETGTANWSVNDPSGISGCPAGPPGEEGPAGEKKVDVSS